MPDETDERQPGLGGRDLVELWFDDDAEAIGQGREDSLHFSDESDLEADDGIWFSDEAESLRAASPLLEYLEDTWDSSQSTLDVRLTGYTDTRIAADSPCS